MAEVAFRADCFCYEDASAPLGCEPSPAETSRRSQTFSYKPWTFASPTRTSGRIMRSHFPQNLTHHNQMDWTLVPALLFMVVITHLPTNFIVNLRFLTSTSSLFLYCILYEHFSAFSLKNTPLLPMQLNL